MRVRKKKVKKVNKESKKKNGNFMRMVNCADGNCARMDIVIMPTFGAFSLKLFVSIRYTLHISKFKLCNKCFCWIKV